MRRSNWKSFEDVLNQYGITKLYHFTDRSNLNSIIQNRGLLSWADCEEKGISIAKPGGDMSSRIYDKRDNLHHYVRLSFTNQHPMMFVARRERRIPNPVVLEIDKSVIFEDNTLFSNMNAVKRGASIGGDLSAFNNIHFSSVIRNKHFDLPVEEQKYFQAEVLVQNYIPLEKIYNIGDFKSPLPSDLIIKQVFGSDKYLYDREAVDMLSTCLWELSHTNYVQGVCLSTLMFEMFDYDGSLKIFVRGTLDEEGQFHLVISKGSIYGICSVPLEHFINILISLNMFDGGVKRKLSLLFNR